MRDLLHLLGVLCCFIELFMKDAIEKALVEIYWLPHKLILPASPLTLHLLSSENS